MDPFTIAALVGGAGSVLSSIFGGAAEHEANQTNRKIAEQNYQLALQQYKDQLLGGIDAQGNRTHFIDGVGWVTNYGPGSQAAYDYYLSHELPALQSQFQRNDVANRAQSDEANALLDQFQRIQRGNPADYERMLYAAASRGIGEATNDSLEVTMRNALRSGASNSANIAGNIAKEGQKALGDAALNAKLQALDYTDSKYATERGNTANLYNAFADRARQQLNSASNPGTPASSGLVSNPTAPQQAGVQADTGMANAFGGIGSSLSGIANAFGAQQQQAKTNALLEQYLSQGGNFSTSNGGIFSSVADRSRNNTGGVF